MGGPNGVVWCLLWHSVWLSYREFSESRQGTPIELTMPRHLAYCTNVHAGTDVVRIRENLREHALRVKATFAPRASLGVGLWLPAPVARQLRDREERTAFARWLEEHGLLPFTCNGFPYGDFHEPHVKHRVYEPNWLRAERLDYTLDLVTVLDSLLPAGHEGSISTLPIAWGDPPLDRQQLAHAAGHLRQIAQRLETLETQTGRLIYLCLEPEPGCVLQRSDDIVRFFDEALGAQGEPDRWRRYLRVCHDVCHAAVMFEDQRAVLAKYAAHDIAVGKVQVSAALRIDFDALASDDRALALAALASFAEDRYLHQTCVRSASTGQVQFFADLPQALLTAPPAGQWRVHFHVPIYADRFGLLGTTQADIRHCLEHIAAADPNVRHFEVETYAWSVLPEELRAHALGDAIARELQWCAAAAGDLFHR